MIIKQQKTRRKSLPALDRIEFVAFIRIYIVKIVPYHHIHIYATNKSTTRAQICLQEHIFLHWSSDLILPTKCTRFMPLNLKWTKFSYRGHTPGTPYVNPQSHKILWGYLECRGNTVGLAVSMCVCVCVPVHLTICMLTLNTFLQ